MTHTYKVGDILEIISNPVIWKDETAHQYEIGQEVIVLAVGENVLTVKRNKVKCADRWNLRQVVPIECVAYVLCPDSHLEYPTQNEKDAAYLMLTTHTAEFKGIIKPAA